MADPGLKRKLAGGEFFLAPGVFDMMSTLMANRVGFDCVYASGFWLTASYLGIPDAGLATYTDMLNRVSRVVELSEAPVIADADTGFGGLLNLRETVRGYERAGVSGFQLEDQEFPKKCGHTPNRRVVPMQQMTLRLKVALDTRVDEDMLIIGRTDARTGEGLDEAIDRAQRMAELGVDLVFIEALETVDEMQRVCRDVPGPLMANMVNSGSTPFCSASQLEEMGFACAIFPATASLAANAAVERALRRLKNVGTCGADTVPLFDFAEFCKVIGFDDVWAFEEKWVDDPGSER
ncbi:MAG: isocitrate lyase/PEP mutase family protein [Pseudomonadota bacterium]